MLTTEQQKELNKKLSAFDEFYVDNKALFIELATKCKATRSSQIIALIAFGIVHKHNAIVAAATINNDDHSNDSLRYYKPHIKECVKCGHPNDVDVDYCVECYNAIFKYI